MKITSEMLFFLLSQKHSLSFQHVGLLKKELSGIRIFHPEDPIKPDYLYIMKEETFRALPKRRPKSLLHILLAGKHSRKEKERLLGTDTVNLAVTMSFSDLVPLYETVVELYQELLRQESELLLATIASEREESVLSFGRKWFPWEYSIVDLDMHLLYRTDQLHKILGEEKVSRIPSESLNELILSREFHNAAKVRDVFYQNMTFSDLSAMGRNIFADNQYIGRVVLFLPSPLTRAPKGAEELFEFYTDCISETLHRSARFAGRKQNDPLHLLCRSLYQGERTAEHAINDVLKRYEWNQEHLYTVISFRFLADTAWEAQLETTLPYLADELEREWPDSCAVIGKREVTWILNLTLSKIGSDLHGFHQQIAYFVRDHVCIAGVSSAFRNFSLLKDAQKCAEAALEIGQQKNPDFWFYRFDNYRLDFIKQALRTELSTTFLIHPAVYKLMQYDEKNQGDLSETLKAYLSYGRNMTAAANAIFVHRTTFCRRMDNIKKVTGLDLEDLDTVIQLEMAYQLLE